MVHVEQARRSDPADAGDPSQAGAPHGPHDEGAGRRSPSSSAGTGSSTVASADPTRPPRWRRLDLLVLAVLTLVLVGVGLAQAASDAPTVDEGVDLSAGLTGLVRHDLRLNPEHALVIKLSEAPALLADPVLPDTAAYRRDDWFTYSDQFVTANRRAGKLRDLLLLARLLPLAETAGCLWLVAALGRRLFGRGAGVLSAGLWATTPFVVGIGHFASIDVAFTLATLAVSLALLRFLDRRTTGRAVAVGAAVGWALATRHLGLVLLAVALVVVVAAWRDDRRRALVAGGTVAVVSTVTVWALYRLVAPSAPGGAAGAQLRGIIDRASSQSVLARLVTALPLPLEWRAGYAYLDLTSSARPASLFGQSWVGTRWWYLPGVVVAKIPWGALVAVAAGCWCLRRVDTARRRRALASVALPALALLAATAAQPLELGVRLVLPCLALALVLAGPVVTGLRHRRGRIGLGALALTQLAAFGLALPHPLTWTPPPLTPNFRWVSDSNIDYGQAEFELESWSQGRGRGAWVSVADTRGLRPPRGTKELVTADPRSVRGWVAVGVTPLTVLHPAELSWVRAYCPVGTLGGGAILLYRFDRAPDPAPGPSRPAGACPAGARFSSR